MNDLNDKWILVGALGAVFVITISFSYGPSLSRSLFGLSAPQDSLVPAMVSPTPMVTKKVTKTVKVTNHGDIGDMAVSPMSPSSNNPDIDTYNQSMVPVPDQLTGSSSPSPTLDVSPSTIPSPSPTPYLTPSETPSPSPTQYFSSSQTSADPTPTASPTPVPSLTPDQSAKININTADAAQLDQITGVGPTIAQRIIDYRTANGPFQTIEDIINVKGIGDVTFQKMKDEITVGS